MGKITKAMLSLLLSLLLVLSGLPMEGLLKAYALSDITITHFDYIQTNDAGNTGVRVVIQGTNFRQIFPPKTDPESVITNIMVRSGPEAKSLMQGDAVAQGVKVDVQDSLITITAPKTGDFQNLHIDTNAQSTITVNTKGLTTNSYVFDIKVNKLPSMPGNLSSKKNYVGQKLVIEGSNFTGVTNTVIAGASHKLPEAEMQVFGDTKIEIPSLKKGTLNKEEKIQFIKKDISAQTTPGAIAKPITTFTAEYLKRVIVFEKLPGMDNLRVLPSEGPYNRPSKITIQALENPPSTVVKENIFKNTSKVFIRHTDETTGKETELPLTNIKLVKDQTNKVVAIEGYTPTGTRPINSKWDVVIKEDNVPNSEGIAPQAFTFVAGDNAPKIESVDPSEGPNTGGTDVLIKGRNIFNVRTPGLTIPNAVHIVPNGDATKEGNQTLVVNYTVPAGVTYGDQPVTEIKRKISVRIATMTNANAGKIYSPYSSPQVLNPPKPGDIVDGKKYGEFHYMTVSGDGLLVTTTNSGTDDTPQEVLLDMETIIKVGEQEIKIPEGAKYTPFKYNEKNPTPKVESIELEYGYPNDSAEEEEPNGDPDGFKPIMIRIKGKKFEAYKEGTEMKYPSVQFVLPDGTVLPMKSSDAKGDTKVLNALGNPIDGIYNKTGEILVVSLIPTDKARMRDLIRAQSESPGGYKELKGIIQVSNPSGNTSASDSSAAKFIFRRPLEETSVDTHNKQPTITSVTNNGAPVKKLPSDREITLEVRVKATAGISDLKKTKIAVDGLDISKGITKAETKGEENIFTVKIPKGFIGKTRLQVIVPEGLMDSKWIIFDNVLGPEIKEIIPNEGDKGSIVVIKRSTQNTVGFKVPLKDSLNEEERIGSRVLWNGQDINELYGGYQKDGLGKVVYQTVDDFKSYKQNDASPTATSVSLPSKYVYVVDSDTIYLKIPEHAALIESTYKVQIKNPDGSESSVAVPFKVADSVDKIKIASITPDRDDSKGGIVVTIKAGVENGRQTNFKGGIDVYFGSQKATVINYDVDYLEAYVKVPPLVDFVFPDILQEKVYSYTVPVTVQNKVKSTDTKSDGFIYLNPAYTIKITEIYNEKYATDPKNQNANKGVEGEFLFIRGENFRLQEDPLGSKKYILPKVMFGYTTAEEPADFEAKNMDTNGDPILDAAGRAELEWIKVKIPKRPFNVGADGSVTILVQNPDGAKAVRDKGFIYKVNKPVINQKASILRASRFTDNVLISAKDIVEKDLTVAFGLDKDMKYEKAHGAKPMEIETLNQVEKIVVKYTPHEPNNIGIYYKKGNQLILMEDTEGTTQGKVRLKSVGEKLRVGLNWKNPAYHSTKIIQNPELLAKLNKEYMDIYVENKAPGVNTLVVRRGLGKVTNFVLDDRSGDAKISVDTPYYEKEEITKIRLTNSDGSFAEAPFEFHSGFKKPIIEDVTDSKEDPAATGQTPMVKLKTQDVKVDGEMEIIGQNFKDIEYISIGDKNLEIISVSRDYKSVKVKIPKGDDALVNQRLPILIVTKEGNAISNKPEPGNPIIHFMYIKPGSQPIIQKINPSEGPRTGGTYVRIEGKGFKETDEFGVKNQIKVTFNGIPATFRELITNDQGEIIAIDVEAPKAEAGKGSVRVINGDEGSSAPAEFTYVSQPVIEKRVPAGAPDEKGEQWMRLSGEDFQQGAKVYIGGERIKVTKASKDKQNKSVFGMGPAVKGLNTFYELVGAQEVKDVKVEDSKNLQFTLPKELDLEDSLIIRLTVINPDTGISKEFETTAFDTPVIGELVPNQGPAGSLVWIKADARGDGFIFDRPPLTTVQFDGEDIPAEVKDAGNILFRVPDGKPKGDYEVTVTNQVKQEDGTYAKKKSPAVIFRVIETKDRIELLSIDPNKGDIAGGNPATITVKSGTFTMEDKVFFGSQEALVEGRNPEGTKIYVRVPKWTGKKIKVGESVPVTITVQKKSGATGSLIDGFIYHNTGDSDKVKITAVYKDGVSPKTDRGRAQDVFWVEGNHFVVQLQDSPQRVLYPDVYIGHEKADILEEYLPSEIKDKRILNKIPIRIPERTKMDQPQEEKPGAGQKKEDANRVDVTVVNPDGSVGRLEKGFEYLEGGEDIEADTKKLTASRFGDKLKIESRNIPRDHYVVFGKNAIAPDEFDLGIREQQWTTTHSDIEKVVIKYLGPEKENENFEIYYQKKDGRLLLMGEGVDGGKVTLRKPGDKKLIKLDWKNPEYHENTKFAQNPALLNKLNDEYMLLELVKTKGQDKVTLKVTRGIGKVDDVKVEARKDNDKDHYNKVTTFVTTPYHERAEETHWTLITKDGQRIFDSKIQENLRIEFTEPVTGLMEITDIEGSELKKINIDGRDVDAKVKTVDIRQPGIIKIIGKGFNLLGGSSQGSGGQVIRVEGDLNQANAQNQGSEAGSDIRVKIAGKYVQVLSIGENGDYIVVQLPMIDKKDWISIRNKPISVDAYSKKGNVFSSKMIPPIYLMFIQPESTPKITEYDPDKGPRTGGTRVTIKGGGFRDLDAVGVPGSIKYSIDGSKPTPVSKTVRDDKGNIKELEIMMPSGKTGMSKIQIINADGGASELKDFRYVSQPKIHSVHIKDNQLVIQGIDFQDKAKAYLGSTLQIGGQKPNQPKETGILGVENGKNRPAYVLGGKDYATEYVSDRELKIILNDKEKSSKTADELMKDLLKGILNTTIIIYNSDEGVSEPSGKATEALIPDVPVITASAGAEGSVVLSWKVDQNMINKAKKFEIYAKVSSDKEYVFVGDTMQDSTNQAFIVKGLEHGVNYDFKVRVLNDAGEAKDFGTVRGFTLSAANDYKQKEKQAEVDRAIRKIETEGKQEIVGNAVRYTVGTTETIVDLTKHTKYKDKQVQIPIREVQSQRGKTLRIIDGNMSIQLTYASLVSPEIAAASGEALIRIRISSADSKKEGALRKAIGRNKSRLSSIYKLDFEVIDPKKTQKIKQLTGKVDIGIRTSQGQGGYVATYVEAEDKFRKLPDPGISKGGYYVLLRDKN